MRLKLVNILYIFCLISLVNLKVVNASNTQKASDTQNALKGSFSQSKTIKPLKRPFQSSGQFIYLPNKGLLWQTLLPVISTKLFAHNGLYSIDDEGNKTKEASLDNAFFLSLFSGDEQALKTYFEVIGNDSESDVHCLALRPNSDALKKLFLQIDLCRKEDVNHLINIPSKITLHEHKGNATVINLEVNSTLVNEKELALFKVVP